MTSAWLCLLLTPALDNVGGRPTGSVIRSSPSRRAGLAGRLGDLSKMALVG
jgi:hypothetical protein